VDNSRIEEVLNAVAAYLGVRIDQLPVAASAPEYVHEKAVAIAMWAVALGVFTHIGDPPNVIASTNVVNTLTHYIEGALGGKIYVDSNPFTAAAKMLEVIEAKRSGLGI